MKLFDRIKTFELFLFVIFAAVCFYRIVVASNIYEEMSVDTNLKVVCLLLWGAMFLGFFMIFVDFSMFARQNQNLSELSTAANTDTVAHINNRYSVDSIIDKYAEKEIPKEIGCAMIELTSLMNVNADYGRMAGNSHIRNFSLILSMSALDECILGRNGGNRFIVLYEKSAELHLGVFLDRLSEKVRDHNAHGKNYAITYAYGTAFAGADKLTSITDMIALSSKRLNAKKNNQELEETDESVYTAPKKTVAEEDVPWDADAPEDYAYTKEEIENAGNYQQSAGLSPEDRALIGFEKERKINTKRTRSMIARRSM